MQNPLAPRPTLDPQRRRARRRAVMQVFVDEGWGSLELVDEWDGADLADLRSVLRPDEYETLLDRLRDQEDARR